MLRFGAGHFDGRRFLRYFYVATILLGCAAANADAHAVLVETAPQNNQTLVTPPAEIRFVFNEVVTPVSVQLLDASAKPVSGVGPVLAIDSTLHLKLPATLPVGVYIASYRIISADSHPVGGSFVFGIGMDPLASPPPQTIILPNAAAWQVIATVLRVIFDGGILIVTGAILFQILIGPAAGSASTGRYLIFVAVATVISAALLPGVLGAQLTAAPLTAFWHGDVWQAGIKTSLGGSMAVAIMGLLFLIGGSVSRDRGMGLAVAVPGALIALAGFALSGHAATADPIWLSAPLLYLHTLCVAYWVGALIPLDRLLRTRPPASSAPLVRMFSYHAVFIVAAAITCGLILAAIQLRSFATLLTTEYGQRLLIKIVLVSVLLFAAAFNKLVLSRSLAAGSRRAAAWLRHMIHIEMGLVTAILIATVLLGQSVPPRETTEDAPNGVSAMAMEGDRMAMIDATPGRAGPNRLTLQLSNEDNTALDPISVTIWLSNPTLGIEAMKVTPTKESPGRYVVPAAAFPVGGNWTATIETVVTDFDETDFSVELPIH